MRKIFVLIFVSLILAPVYASAQTHGCTSKCLARGGLPNECKDFCGVYSNRTKLNEDGKIEHSCLSKCLARGGFQHDCNESCGIVSTSSFGDAQKKRQQEIEKQLEAERLKEIERRRQLERERLLERQRELQEKIAPKDNVTEILDGIEADDNQDKDKFMDCYATHCRGGLSGAAVEECIENCAKLSVIRFEEETRKLDHEITGESKFKDVDFECMKSCREADYNKDECRTACKE